ncbi:MAG: prepilin-type N-terminal cleavage/methylation domain-containing protein [Gemmatimonadota bacterium]|nr:prepilin-type N-terminal cleavage/methylation domain-containing protein [Gemmatimonadota bacterium]
MRSPSSEAGFTLVELVVAVVILAVGILGFLGTSALLVRQGADADLRTERAAARQSAIERLRAAPYDSVIDGAALLGRFDVRWVVEDFPRVKNIRVITVGPGLAAPAPGEVPTLMPAVADTAFYRIPRP